MWEFSRDLFKLALVGFGLISSSETVAQVTSPNEQAPVSASETAHNSSPDIVVVAPVCGKADVDTEKSFDSADIAATGADDIEALLLRLRSRIDPAGGEPIVLINGRPTGFDRSILRFPPEALIQLDLLKRKAGAHYGTNARQRVVNLILKRRFSSVEIDSGVTSATAGGKHDENIGISQSAISGDTRWNAQVHLQQEGMLIKSARPGSAATSMLDRIGFISALDGREIDPALSAFATAPVKIVTLPQNISGPPVLADFATDIGRSSPLNPWDFESLLPSARIMSGSINVARPIGSLSATVGVDIGNTVSSALTGLPIATLRLPASGLWNPFHNPILINRPLTTNPLTNKTITKSIAMSATLAGLILGFQTSLGATFSYREASSNVETGADVARLQQSVNEGGGSLDPYTYFDASLIQRTRSRSANEIMSMKLNIQKSIIRLPAGGVGWNLLTTMSRAQGVAGQSNYLVPQTTQVRSSSVQSTSQISVNIPVSHVGTRMRTLGDLDVNLGVGVARASSSSVQKTFSFGFVWVPKRPIQLTGSVSLSDNAPSFDQLFGPMLSTLTPTFDFMRKETALVKINTGGEDKLKSGHLQNLSISALIRPLSTQDLSFNVGYIRSVMRGSPGSFPDFTPAVETAFPDRIIRDGDGRLISIDARPINVERDVRASIHSNMALHLQGPRPFKSDLRGSTQLPESMQYGITIDYDLALQSKIVVRRGLPPIDRLNGGGATSRDSLGVTADFGKQAFGASVNASWSRPTRIVDIETVYQTVNPILVSFASFINVDQVYPSLRKTLLARNLKIYFGIQNIFNSRRKLTSVNGSVASGYDIYQVDPLGRTIQLSIRKRIE